MGSEDRTKLQNLLKLQNVLVEMSALSEPDEVLNFIVESAIDLTGATSGSIMLIDSDGYLEVKYYKNLNSSMIEKTRLKVGEGITGWVAEKGFPKISNDVSLEPSYVPVSDDVKSELAVPLVIKGRVVGVVNVDSTKKNAFSQEDVETLTVLASEASQILDKVRMEEILKKKVVLQEALIEASRILSGVSEGLSEVFRKMVNLLANKLGIERAMLVLADSSNENLKVVAGYGFTKDELERATYRVGEGITGLVFSTGETIGVKDIRKDSRFANKTRARRKSSVPVSFIAAPIKEGARIVGVISVEKILDEDLFDDEVRTITLLGSMSSRAVENYIKIEEEKRKLIDENEHLKRELMGRYGFSNIVGKSEQMNRVFELVSLVSSTDASVLITGESGTGKELIARAIHYGGKRKSGPFVAVNCAAIPEQLLEAELFGYEKGAFTGAVSKRKGKFELASGGTIFLDEISEMSPSLQAKLLRVLQEKEVEPIGSEKVVKVDVRIISATNKNLEEEVKEGRFRKDLYYRLNVVRIHLPPLRERLEDIPLLVDHFVKMYSKKYGRKVRKVSADVMNILMSYSFPGNVRELENIIERAVVLAKGDTITVDLLPADVIGFKRFYSGVMSVEDAVDIAVDKMLSENSKGVYPRILEGVERKIIEKVLSSTGGNQVRASEILGIHRNTLREKIKKHFGGVKK